MIALFVGGPWHGRTSEMKCLGRQHIVPTRSPYKIAFVTYERRGITGPDNRRWPVYITSKIKITDKLIEWIGQRMREEVATA